MSALSHISAEALEKLSLDMTINEKMREKARIYQLCVEDMDWKNVFYDKEMCQLILFSLQRWIAKDNCAGLSRAMLADVRSMIGELNVRNETA